MTKRPASPRSRARSPQRCRRKRAEGVTVMTCADPPLMTTTDAVTGHVEETLGRRVTKLYLSLWMRCLFSVPMFATS